MTDEKMTVPENTIPVLAAAVEAAGLIVAARVAKGHFYSDTSAETYGLQVQAIASQTMKALFA